MGLPAQERNVHHHLQDGCPYRLPGPPFPLEKVGKWPCPQGRIFSFAQGDPEKERDNPEDPANGPYSHRESNVDIAVSSSKEQGAEPEAISFLGALKIPVRCSWNEGKRISLEFSIRY